MEVEVDSEDTPVDKLLTPVLRLLTSVLNEDTPVLRLLTPVLNEDTPVLNEDTPVLNEDTPVLRLLILLVAVDRPVDVDVLRLLISVSSATATLYSWLPLMAFVEVAETSPSATPWICRLPMATTPLVGAWFTVNVEPETTPLAVVQLVVAVTAAATEPLPSATELASETLVLRPRANPSTALTVALAPSA